MPRLAKVSASFRRSMQRSRTDAAAGWVTFEFGAEVELEPGDDEVTVTAATRELVRANVMAELAAYFPSIASELRDLLAGLPADLQSAMIRNTPGVSLVDGDIVIDEEF